METRLRIYFKDEESYNNLMNIYKQLKKDGKKDMMLFLKGVVKCCLSRQKWDYKTKSFNKTGCWMSADSYFTPYGGNPYYSAPFTLEKLERLYNAYIDSDGRFLIFGHRVSDFMKKMI